MVTKAIGRTRSRGRAILMECLEDRLLLSAADPDPREQYMFELLNRFRMDPVHELPLLLTSGNTHILSALNTFGVDLSALVDAFSTLTAVSPVAWNAQIYNAALAHDQLMLTDDTQSHQLPGEQDIGGRITAVGYNWDIAGENIYAFSEDPLYGHAGFVIDWGNDVGGVQNPAGHRDNMLTGQFRDSATAIIDGIPNRNTGPTLVTQDFASKSSYGNPMLTGVVFNDADNDGFYTQGEGIAGATVHIVGTSVNQTITTLTAGMYQLALPAGSYTLTYTGTFGTRTQSITMGNANAELDLNTSAAAPTSTSVTIAASTASGFTLASTVTSSAGTPSGTVTFYNGTTVIGTSTLVNGTATLVTNTLPRTTGLLIAVYNGSGAFEKSVSNIDKASLTDTVPPTVSAISIKDYTNLAATYTFTVTFTDNTLLDVSTLKDPTAFIINGPRGFVANPSFVSVNQNSNGATRTATYTIAGPGGSWNSVDSGVYGVTLVAGKIRDVSGNAINVSQGLSIFNVAPSPFFNEAWYLARYPDIAAAVTSGVVRSGWDHFNRFGQYEGRQPSVFFSENVYLGLNPDVAAVVHGGGYASGFEHYLLYGAGENRRASAYFDSSYYLAANTDVRTAVNNGVYASAFAHFIQYGLAEKRPAQGYFNQAYYLTNNPDVAAAVTSHAFVSAYSQYVLFGQFEHRNPSALYNDNYYLVHNPDVATAVAGGSFASGFEHYVLYGQFEGRAAHA